jgi:hypothetical protein
MIVWLAIVRRGIVRRVLIIVLVATGLFLLVALLKRSNRPRRTAAEASTREDNGAHPAPQATAAVLPFASRPAAPDAPTVATPEPNAHVTVKQNQATETTDSGPKAEDSGSSRSQTMAVLRAEMAETISHGVLFGMAQERGVSSGLVVASRWDLRDAILRVEHLRPEDEPASAENETRLRELLTDAQRREDEAHAAALAKEAERTIQTTPRERRHRYG